MDAPLDSLAQIAIRHRVAACVAWAVLAIAGAWLASGSFRWDDRVYEVRGSQSAHANDAASRLYGRSWDGMLVAEGGQAPPSPDAPPANIEDAFELESNNIAKAGSGIDMGGYRLLETNYGIAKLLTKRPASDIKPQLPALRRAAADQPKLTWYVSGIAAVEGHRQQDDQSFLLRALPILFVLLAAVGIPLLGLRGTVANLVTCAAALVVGGGLAGLLGRAPGLHAGAAFPGLLTAAGCAVGTAAVLSPLMLRLLAEGRDGPAVAARPTLMAIALPAAALLVAAAARDLFLVQVAVLAIAGAVAGVAAAHTLAPALLPGGRPARATPEVLQRVGGHPVVQVAAAVVVVAALAVGAFHARQPESRLRLHADTLRDRMIRTHDIQSRPFVRDQVVGYMVPVYVFVSGLPGANPVRTDTQDCETHKCPPVQRPAQGTPPLEIKLAAEKKIRKHVVDHFYMADAADSTLSAEYLKGPDSEFDLMQFWPSDVTLDLGMDGAIRALRRYYATPGVLPRGVHASVGGYDAVRVDFRHQVGTVLPWLCGLLALVAGLVMLPQGGTRRFLRVVGVGGGAALAVAVGASVWNIPSVGYRYVYPYHLEPFRWVDQWAAYPLVLVLGIPVALLLCIGLGPERSRLEQPALLVGTAAVSAALPFAVLFSSREPGFIALSVIGVVALAWGGLGVSALGPPVTSAAWRVLEPHVRRSK